MNILVLAFALQLGYTPNDTVIQYQPAPTSVVAESALIVSMDAEVRVLDRLYVGGSLGVPTWWDGTSGWPTSLQSVVRAGLRIDGVEVGWSHLCTHPVIPYQPIFGQRPTWEGSYDEFHVKFSGEVKLW